MNTQAPQHVAIIGAGLSGMTLALSLHAHQIPSTIYELRPPTTHSTASGALMLSPNALSILSSLSIYPRLVDHGYHFEKLAYLDEHYNLTDEYFLGSEEKFGYKALRIYRSVLLQVLLDAVRERGIPIQFGKKFASVLKEDEHGVTFQFADGSTEQAGMLVGADGIHSRVRGAINPGVGPVYSGMMAITSTIQRSSLRLPGSSKDVDVELESPTSVHTSHGAFVFAPQNVDGSELLVGTQRRYPEQDQDGWRVLRNDKKKLLEMFRENMGKWPELVRSAMEGVNVENLSIWPYYVVQKMESWVSGGEKGDGKRDGKGKGRVVILGDAAHAIPPTAGQGASQGFEDAFSLALLLSKVGEFASHDDSDGQEGKQGEAKGKMGLSEALEFWQRYRMERVDRVLELTKKLDVKRLASKDKEKGGVDEVMFKELGGAEQQRWLFEPKIEEVIGSWIDEKRNA